MLPQRPTKEKKVEEQRKLLARIPLVPDLQSAWLILLHCAAARADYFLRVVDLQSVAAYARALDDGIWSCLCALLDIGPIQDEKCQELWQFAIGVWEGWVSGVPPDLSFEIPPHLFRAHFRCPSMRAGVAVQSIRLATTVPHAPGALGRRGFALESAATRVCREAARTLQMVSDWRSWWMDCRSLRGRSWQ